MMNANARGIEHTDTAASAVVFDPGLPLLWPMPGEDASGRNQRARRSTILASIRRLLADEGHEAITVRRVAGHSGYAVQTIYNLVGPRDHAITEAVAEYSKYICLTATPNPADPHAAVAMIGREIRSIEYHPEFCRNVCKMYFSDSRNIFYDFRDRQTKTLHGFLHQQQRWGIIHAKADTRYLAENLMLFMGTIFVEWADSSCPAEMLKQRLNAVYCNVLAETIMPAARRGAAGI